MSSRPLRVEQVRAELDRRRVPVWLISGDEPMQKLEAEDFIRKHAMQAGAQERTVFVVDSIGFKWSEIAAAMANMSLFASARLLELRLGEKKFAKVIAGEIASQIDLLADADTLVITTPRIDKASRRTKWFADISKSIENKGGVCVEVWPISARELPQWIAKRAHSLGLKISGDAAALIAQRVEGNLLAARQELDKLCLLADGRELDVPEIVQAVTDNTRYDIFGAFESACAGDILRTLRILRGVQNAGMEAMACYGALMWELRRLCKMARQWEQGQQGADLFRSFGVWDRARQAAIKQVLHRHSLPTLHGLLKFGIRLERRIKSTQVASAWNNFGLLLLNLAGVRLAGIDVETWA
ncbi:MAG: DNA polymerase III subunit delta [Candidatus Eutrophobiaceae bacterium]